MKLKLSEAQVKKAVIERLQIAQNQGLGVYFRMNAGWHLICPRAIKGCSHAPKFYKVDLAPAGTSDFLWIPSGAFFIETKATGEIQKPEQVEFESMVTRRGNKYILCSDAGQLEEIL